MSGSGPTVFAFIKEEWRRQKAQIREKQLAGQVFVTRFAARRRVLYGESVCQYG